MGGWFVLQEQTTYSVRALGEFGITHFEFGNVTSFQGGGRIVFNMQSNPKVKPFGQFLAGIEHCCGCDGVLGC